MFAFVEPNLNPTTDNQRKRIEVRKSARNVKNGENRILTRTI